MIGCPPCRKDHEWRERAAQQLARIYRNMADIQIQFPGNTIGKDPNPTRLYDEQMVEIGTIIDSHEWRPGEAKAVEQRARAILEAEGNRNALSFADEEDLANELSRLREKAED